MALLVPVRPIPLRLQRRGFFQCSASGMIDSDCSSNSRSRSICILRLAGSFGSGASDVRSLAPISRTIARLCTWSMSMLVRIGGASSKNDAARGRHRPSALPRDRSGAAGVNGDRRLWLSARALILKTAGRWQRPLAIRDMRPCKHRRATISCLLKAWQGLSFRLISNRDAMFHSTRNQAWTKTACRLWSRAERLTWRKSSRHHLR
jgi:hypothetical protein